MTEEKVNQTLNLFIASLKHGLPINVPVDECIETLTIAYNNTSRLKHLLKSPFIRLYDEVDAKGNYKRDIKTANVLFRCNNKRCKNCHPDTCKYTTDPSFAVNFTSDEYGFTENLADKLQWIDNHDGTFTCPVCMQQADNNYNYCMWCGKLLK